jgi:hypothetical protein
MKYVINKFVKYYISIFFIITLTQQNHTQTNFSEDLPSGLSHASIINVNDTIISEIKVEKNYWLPVIEVVGLNLGIGAFNAYLMNEDFAQISWKTIGDNFKTGFVWDEDPFLTNQFMHPFHGAAYFNSARSNGLSFWESAPYTFGGSLMWELFMENEPPSYNDIVNTPVTGIILGEISYRVSNLIIDESTTGFERVLRELSSTIINPMQGFNRLIGGDMWRSGKKNNRNNFDIDLSIGAHNLFLNNKFDQSKTYLMMRVNMDYGDKFDVDANKKPFDYFSLHTEVNAGPDDNIVGILASGVLWDNHLDLFKTSQNMIGIYKEIDILINNVYKLSASSATGQIINTIPVTASLRMENFLGISAILMGATNSDYSAEYDKDHKIGPGASAKAGIRLLLKDLGNIHVNYKRYWIHTLSGEDSEQFVGLLNAGIGVNISNNVSIGLDGLLYERYGEYKYLPDTQTYNAAIRFFVTHRINN